MFPCVSSPVIHVSLAFRTRLILGDPGADSGDEGKSKRAEKCGTKKSKERREEPLGTISYQTSSKRSPQFWLLIGAKKTQVFWHQSEARTTVTFWNWSCKTLSQGLFSPFFAFLRATFFRPFRLSLVPTICPWVSEDALASVRKTKRLRRRQRLNGKAHSSKAMLDEHVWSFSLGLTTKSTSGWNLFRRCCHFTLLSYSWFMKIRNFPAASPREPWEWDRSDSSFPSFDGWRHAWSTAHAARGKIFTIFGEESRYDHMDLEGF